MTPEAVAVRDAVLRHVRPGGRVALGDGAGAPTDVLPGVVAAAEHLGDLEVVCGWCMGDAWEQLDHPAVRLTTFMGGYGLRGLLKRGRARYLPVRLGALPAAYHGALRSDLVIAVGHRAGDRWSPGTEICWVPAAVEAGSPVVLVDAVSLPFGGVETQPMSTVVEVVESSHRPVQVPELPVDDASAVIGRYVAELLPESAVIQYGPGAIGRAVLAAVDRPVRVWSGVITDAVVDLDRRGLLLGDTVATYAVGTDTLYEWINGRRVLTRVERSHDLTALAEAGIWAINTALEIDLFGQINVERIGDDVIAGIGGHADFALAGVRSLKGASVIALPTRRGSRSTLVDRLAVPTSTPRSDVDVVVTECGVADLRGLDDGDRRAALRHLWGDAAPA